jgi:hypothetical protein
VGRRNPGTWVKSTVATANQFIAAAVSEKMASVMTLDYLKLEAAKGSRSDFDRFMNLVPNAPIAEGDELPNH